MRAIFLCAPSKAYGEINTLVQLARNISEEGGEIWFLASPLAAEVAGSHFPGRVFQLTPDLERNQVIFWRMVKKFRPDMIVLSELYEILRPKRKPDCPLINSSWLREMGEIDCALVFVDFIAHVPLLRGIAECDVCSKHFANGSLSAFLERLWVVVPCPLNEPGSVEGRCGIPYQAQRLPLSIEPEARARVRARFLGRSQEEGALVVRTGSSWQTQLAEQYGVSLYEHLGDLLGAYLGNLPRPVTLVSVSSRHQISSIGCGFRIHNIANLPPREFDELVLSSDLVISDNEIGYTLAKTVGSVPSLILKNTFTREEILKREPSHSPVRRIVLEMESRRPDSIYPHKIFPIPAHEEELAEQPPDEHTGAHDVDVLTTSTLRLGRMLSSPFVKAELYGGEETRDVFERLLCDPCSRNTLREQDTAYIERFEKLETGATVLSRLAIHNSLTEHIAL